MLPDREFVKLSLELNLFFFRIMKEHAIFAAASLPPKGMNQAYQLIATKNNYEKLLEEAIGMSNGIISPEVFASEELVTEMTLPAEMKTQALTGIPIDMKLTRQELALKPGRKDNQPTELLAGVTDLNRRAHDLTRDTLAFLVKLFNDVLECKAFSFTYPTMIEHVAEETEHYLHMLDMLEKREAVDSKKDVIHQEQFWNDIMDEHTKFIRGYLDPSEEALFNAANAFAKEFDTLLEETNAMKERPGMLPEVTKESLTAVSRLKEFKEEGTEGILECEIRSVILPLLSDHVLREANHYLRMLRTFYDMSLRDFTYED